MVPSYGFNQIRAHLGQDFFYRQLQCSKPFFPETQEELGCTCMRVFVHAWHLVLLSATLLIVVEDVLPDVLPAIMVSRDMVDTLLQALIASPAAVEEDSQQ